MIAQTADMISSTYQTHRNSPMTPIQDYYPSPKGFLWRILGFSIVALIFVVGPMLRQGEFNKLVLPLAVIGGIVTASLVYLHFRKTKPRLRLFEEGLEGEHGCIAWDNVDQLDLKDYGDEAQAMSLQIELKNGSTVSEDLDDLDAPPREVFRQIITSFNTFSST